MHLGVQYEWLRDENGEKYLLASMEKYAKDIIETYESYYKQVSPCDSPGFVKEYLVSNKVEMKMQEEYRYLVGKLLYYTIKIGI